MPPVRVAPVTAFNAAPRMRHPITRSRSARWINNRRVTRARSTRSADKVAIRTMSVRAATPQLRAWKPQEMHRSTPAAEMQRTARRRLRQVRETPESVATPQQAAGVAKCAARDRIVPRAAVRPAAATTMRLAFRALTAPPAWPAWEMPRLPFAGAIVAIQARAGTLPPETPALHPVRKATFAPSARCGTMPTAPNPCACRCASRRRSVCSPSRIPARRVEPAPAPRAPPARSCEATARPGASCLDAACRANRARKTPRVRRDTSALEARTAA